MSLAEERLAALRGTELDDRTKGIPLGSRLTLAELGEQRWNVARGDLALPVVTLRESALENNITTMARYCTQHGAHLAPHGKTTMAPQLFRRQLEAGAWGITAATPTQAAVMRHYGVRRILIANQLVEPDAVRWVAREMTADRSLEIFSLVDSPATVDLLDAALVGMPGSRRLPVLLESGILGGRSGTRGDDEALEVAKAVDRSPHLYLAGVETYEGLVTSALDDAALACVDAVLARVRALVFQLAEHGLFHGTDIVVSAGGSAYFDRVVAALGDWTGLGLGVQLVLRSGCYVTHDAGKYQRVSPLDGRRSAGEPMRLVNALEGWGRVLSVPEPGLAVVGIGKRDLSYDVELPIPLSLYGVKDGSSTDLVGRVTVGKLMDQHCFLQVPPELRLEPGDIVKLGISHPCTTFDKTTLIPVVDDDFNVIDGILTFF